MNQPTPAPAMAPARTTRSLSTIAAEIKADWRPMGFAAAPYADAMLSLDKITDKYMFDEGRSIVLYFLSNAQQWKGEVARRIKAELKAILKQK